MTAPAPLKVVTAWPRQHPRLFWGGLLALMLLAALLLWQWLGAASTPAEPVVTEPIKRGDIEKMVAATGKVVANFEVEIKAKASGRIIRLPYDVSDEVREGDLLVELDPIDESREVSQAAASLSGLESRTAQSRTNLTVAERNLQTDLARARADLQAAQAKAQDAETKARRLSTLVQSRYISQEEYETGMTTATQAKTDLNNAQIRLRELQTAQLSLRAQAQDVQYSSAQAQAQRVALATSRQRLADTKIYAPISGVVTTRLGQIGQIVSSGISNVGGGTAILTLADLSHIYVLASVDESDIGQVRPGQRVKVTADAFPGDRFEGRVVRISPKGLVESNVVTFEVKIEIEGENRNLLKPEMTTNVEIVTEEKENVLLAPAEALDTDERGRSFVMVLPPAKDQKPQRRPVTPGINNGTTVEIVRGLREGEAVVLSAGQPKSRWRKEDGGEKQGGRSGGERRGQMMMMRSLGGRR